MLQVAITRGETQCLEEYIGEKLVQSIKISLDDGFCGVNGVVELKIRSTNRQVITLCMATRTFLCF